MLIDCLGHLKHIQFFPAENRLQLVVGEDFTLVLRILEFVLLDMRPDLFGHLRSLEAVLRRQFWPGALKAALAS